jgi:NAD(P)-dependent dehydrogenase (short-subunit alcohol dehydrogenase family)
VQDTGGDFGLSGSDRAWLGGLSALIKTAAQEWPDATLKAIDIDRADRDVSQVAEALTEELLSGGPELEVGLSREGRRITLRSRPVETEEGTPALDPNSVVVASGGARGVTAAALIELTRTYRCSMVLLGRTELHEEPACCVGITDDAELKRSLLERAKHAGKNVSPAQLGAEANNILAMREIRATLAAMEAVGSRARYVSVNVQDATAVSHALDRVRKEWGPITALVHGAGVLADRWIAEKTRDQFDRVFDTKVLGLQSLLDATADDPLTLLCLFSSVAARSGNSGQCDYAMANEVLNKVANLEASRRGDECLVKSMNWGPWEGGMVTPTLKARFEANGVPLIPLEVGAKMLVDEIRGRFPNQVELVLGAPPLSTPLLTGEKDPKTIFDVQVSETTHPYLADHSIQNVPVIPVVMVLEWFTRAAQATRPDLEVAGCRELKVLRGIRLTRFRDQGNRFRVSCHQKSEGEDTFLHLELRGEDDTLHYTAKADMAGRIPHHTATKLPDMDLKPWEIEIYGDALFHGPQFQVIQSMDGVSSKGIAAHLRGTADLGWNGEPWRTDVAALDGGLQLALLWSQHVLGGRSLPTSVGMHRTYGRELPKGSIHCTLQGKVVSHSKTMSNLQFRDEDGKMIAEMHDVETVLLPESPAPKVAATESS